MIKKAILHNDKHAPQKFNTTKTIIFDLSGVLLIKNSKEQLSQNSESTALMFVINFLETIALLKACKESGHKLFVLSNMTVSEYEKIKEEPEIASLFSFFDDIVISEMTPYKKPDAQIFTYLCEQYNLQPTDCVFIDDKQDNLDGAHEAAISKTILCSNFDLVHVRNELVSHGILQHKIAFELNIPTGQA